MRLLLPTDHSAAKEIRPGGAGDRGAVDTTPVDVGPVGHYVLHRQRRVFCRRRSHRGTYIETWRHGTRGLPARRRVERRDRGQPEKRVPMDT